jgi:RNA polymerase sigma factor (sigma-70 family)
MQFASLMSAKKVVRPVLPGTNQEWVTPSLEESADYQLLLLRAFELPPICREVIVLRDLHGHGVQEIAARLGISRAAVEKRLRRAERWLSMRSRSTRIS